MRTHRTLVAACAALALVLAACSSASPSPSGTVITATLTEYKITLSATTAPAGKVTFDVTNGGTMIHEFVVLKTDKLAKELPIVDAAVNEADFAAQGEVPETNAGAGGKVTLTLVPGHYAIICNIAGHVGQGMVADFTVQ